MDIRQETQRRALVKLLSNITGKSHSRIISKMRDLGIVSYQDFLAKHKEVYRDMTIEIDRR